MQRRIEREAAMGQEDTVLALERMLERVKSGEVTHGAVRIFNKDGTWTDMAFGEDEDRKAELLEQLRTQHKRDH